MLILLAGVCLPVQTLAVTDAPKRSSLAKIAVTGLATGLAMLACAMGALHQQEGLHAESYKAGFQRARSTTAKQLDAGDIPRLVETHPTTRQVLTSLFTATKAQSNAHAAAGFGALGALVGVGGGTVLIRQVLSRRRTPIPGQRPRSQLYRQGQ